MNDQTTRLHKILIVGGGAAGLELATSLGNKLGKKGLADVTLLDASATHIWKPLLHEVASGVMDSAEGIEYQAQGYRNHFNFRLGRMSSLDRNKKRVHVSPTLSNSGEQLIPARSFEYDTLVMAIGSISNTFGIPGVDEHCLFLDTVSQAFRFQRHLVKAYMKAHFGKHKKPGELMSIVIIGAGATGVELSAELSALADMLAVYGLDKASDLKITIIEASPQLLKALPHKLAAATQQQLVKLGIELKLGCRVVEVTEQGVKTVDGEMIHADLTVWAAGIKAPDWIKGLAGLETNAINQLVVDETLLTNDTDIFAIGDCAACPWPDHEGNVPPRAQAAHQQASTLCKSIVNRLKGENAIAYVYRDYGSLVSLGKYTTVGNLMGSLMGTVTIGGLIAKIVYLSLYKMHQVAVHGYFRTLMLTLANIFRRSTHARIKLH